jgi:plasmid stabilization system protein ParE
VAKRFRVIVADDAERDVKSIYEYIRRDKPLAAKKWKSDFRRQTRSLRLLPERFEVVPEANELPDRYRHFRHLLFGRYRIIYEIGTNVVRIKRVIDSAPTRLGFSIRAAY